MTLEVQGPFKDVILQFCSELDPLIDRLFASVDDYFFDRANKAKTQEEQAVFFDAMRRIRLHRQSISDAFYDNWLKSLTRFSRESCNASPGKSAKPLDKINFDEITIQSDTQAEISAAKSMIVTRAHTLYGHDAACLLATLDSIIGAEHGAANKNPLDIRAISDAFCNAIASLALENSAALCLLMLFEREVSARLGNLYSGALTRLAESGVRIVRPAKQAADRKSPVREQSPASSEAVAEFRVLQQHLAHGEPGVTPIMSGGRGCGGAASFNVEALFDSLTVAQDLYLDHLSGGISEYLDPIPNLRSFLLGIPAEQGGFQNAGLDELDTLRLVSDLFERIFGNPDVSLACKSLVARLQFPVLTIAIVDRSFFSDSAHPARQFLNKLAHDGVGWPNSGPMLDKHRIYQAAQALVQRIIDGLPCDRELFQHALDQWNNLVKRRNAQTDATERRVNETALGHARLAAARRIVERLINQATGTTLPTELIAFIQGKLFQALVMVCIKFGTESTQWKEMSAAYVNLVRAGRGDTRANGRPFTTTDVSALIARLAKTLQVCGHKQESDSQAIRKVEKALHDHILSAKTETPVRQPPNVSVMERIEVTKGVVAEKRIESDPRLDELVPGTWIEVQRDTLTGPLRCRLVVFVDDAQTYVFANDDGVKSYESTAIDMLRNLDSGRIRIISEEPALDRAMSDLVRDLRAGKPIDSMQTAQ